ncbi:MAG: pentapeptide repeat-containing protein, partial [Clostridia bacterium]|nr:pentapeptide repeat-containing protein [Clostridia bacterium]
SGASLSGASLSGASLSGVSLSGVSLSGVSLGAALLLAGVSSLLPGLVGAQAAMVRPIKPAKARVSNNLLSFFMKKISPYIYLVQSL